MNAKWPSWVGWAGLIAVVILSLAPLPAPDAPEGSDKLGHVLAWLGLTAWWGLLKPRRVIVLVLGLLVLGAVLEGVQALLPWRQFEPADLAANLGGVLAGAALARTRMAASLFARLGQRGPDR